MGCGGNGLVVLSWWLDICLLLLCWVAVIIGKEREPEWGGESDQREKERVRRRERIYIYIYILNAHATVTVHICTVTIAIVHLCTILHPLMCVCCWMCKINYFFHFAQLCTYWWDAVTPTSRANWTPTYIVLASISNAPKASLGRGEWNGMEMNEKNNFRIFFPSLPFLCLGVLIEGMESSFPYLEV